MRNCYLAPPPTPRILMLSFRLLLHLWEFGWVHTCELVTEPPVPRFIWHFSRWPSMLKYCRAENHPWLWILYLVCYILIFVGWWLYRFAGFSHISLIWRRDGVGIHLSSHGKTQYGLRQEIKAPVCHISSSSSEWHFVSHIKIMIMATRRDDIR